MKNVLELDGVLEAIAREQLIRDAAFFGLNESIGSFEVKPITLRHYFALIIANSPLLPPYSVTSARELAVFLWLLSPGYKMGDEKKRKKFLKRCRFFMCPKTPWFRTRVAMWRWARRFEKSAKNLSEMIEAARAYMDESLMDRPGTISTSGYQPSFYSGMAAAAGALAREYGGGLDQYLDMPLKILFQLNNERKDDKSTPDAPALLFNRLSEQAMNQALRRNGDTNHDAK